MKTEPLTVINFRHVVYKYSIKIMCIHFEVIDSALIDSKRAKRLIGSLRTRLLNFRKTFDTLHIALTDLDEFFISRVSEKKATGVWHSCRFECSDSSPSENIRRENYNRIPSLISKEISLWTFSHYKTVLRIMSCESK